MSIGGEESLPKILSPDGVVRTLLEHPDSTDNEWLVAPSFTLRHLASLISNRLEEVYFTEYNGQLWVNDRSTKVERINYSSKVYRNLLERETKGKLLAHIHQIQMHPGDSANIAPSWFLSWDDIWNVANEIEPNEKYVLFHSKGGVEYAPPFINKGGIRKLIALFSESVGVDCFSTTILPDLQRHVTKIPRIERLELARKFAIENGMIKQEYEWNDLAGMQRLVDIINLIF